MGNSANQIPEPNSLGFRGCELLIFQPCPKFVFPEILASRVRSTFEGFTAQDGWGNCGKRVETLFNGYFTGYNMESVCTGPQRGTHLKITAAANTKKSGTT